MQPPPLPPQRRKKNSTPLVAFAASLGVLLLLGFLFLFFRSNETDRLVDAPENSVNQLTSFKQVGEESTSPEAKETEDTDNNSLASVEEETKSGRATEQSLDTQDTDSDTTGTDATIAQGPADDPGAVSMEKDTPTSPRKKLPGIAPHKPDPPTSNAIENETPQDGIQVVDLDGKDSPFSVAEDVSSVVFVIDKSSSMEGQRIERVKATLSKTLSRLVRTQSFSLILFDDEAQVWGNRPVLRSATADNVRAARRFLLGQPASGGTDPRTALEFAIPMKPELIMILSDGEFDPFLIEGITALNQRIRKNGRIDCIGLDEVVVTLQELAKRNNGIYYQALSK